MKKTFQKTLLAITLLLVSNFVMAQAPNKMSYQAVIRDNSNALVTNQIVGMKMSILQGSANGTAVYAETQIPTTNTNGLASIEIGGGTLVSGNFSTINWANGPYFIKTETDATGGTNYTITGTSQLLSVPYALSANNLTLQSPNGTYWNLSIDNLGNLSTSNINCIPVNNFNGFVSDSLPAGNTYQVSPVSVQGTIPYSYNWTVMPNDSTILIQNPTSNNPTLIVTNNINPGTSYTLVATASNCNGNNTTSQNFPITVTAPICPDNLPDTNSTTITSNCNINPNVGGTFSIGNPNQIGIKYRDSGNCYYEFYANVNCQNQTLTIPTQNISYNGMFCDYSGTISGSGTFNNFLSQMTITATTVINGISNTCTITFTNN
jgi:hypothetical protein